MLVQLFLVFLVLFPKNLTCSNHEKTRGIILASSSTLTFNEQDSHSHQSAYVRGFFERSLLSQGIYYPSSEDYPHCVITTMKVIKSPSRRASTLKGNTKSSNEGIIMPLISDRINDIQSIYSQAGNIFKSKSNKHEKHEKRKDKKVSGTPFSSSRLPEINLKSIRNRPKTAISNNKLSDVLPPRIGKASSSHRGQLNSDSTAIFTKIDTSKNEDIFESKKHKKQIKLEPISESGINSRKHK